MIHFLKVWVSRMIKTFRHKGLREFFEAGSTRGIQHAHAGKLGRQLLRLNAATAPQDMNIAGWRLHALSGQMAGHWSIWVNGNWRLTFMFEGEDAVLVEDYH
jgi:proteic killer suppression protein